MGPASCAARLSIRRSLPCGDLRWVLNASQSLHSGQSCGEGGHPTRASYPEAASAATVHPTAGASGVGAAPSPHDPERRAGRLLPSQRWHVLCAMATGRASSTLRGVLAFRSSDSDLTSCPRSPGRVPAARRLCGAPSLCPCAGPCPPERVLPVSVVASARKQPGRAVSAPRAVGGLMEWTRQQTAGPVSSPEPSLRSPLQISRLCTALQSRLGQSAGPRARALARAPPWPGLGLCVPQASTCPGRRAAPARPAPRALPCGAHEPNALCPADCSQCCCLVASGPCLAPGVTRPYRALRPSPARSPRPPSPCRGPVARRTAQLLTSSAPAQVSVFPVAFHKILLLLVSVISTTKFH